MMYILEQRLIAQKIPPEKACKVSEWVGRESMASWIGHRVCTRALSPREQVSDRTRW